MGLFDDLFRSQFLFDTHYKQRRDIESLRYEVATRDAAPKIRALEARADQRQLLCNALIEVIERKKLASREELEVLVQQIGLLDGVEDGKQGETWRAAPRCAGCNYFVNPRRDACVYCSHASPKGDATLGGPYRDGRAASAPASAPRTARCANCVAVVPQNETFFTERGELWCARCVRRA